MPWLKKSIQKEITKKHKAFKQYLSTKSATDLHNYKTQRNKTKQVICNAKTDYESSIISAIKTNPKRLHKYIRQRQKVKHTIGSLKKPDGSLTTTNEESAEALACFFKSVFVNEDLQRKLPDFPCRVDAAIPDLVVTEELVYQKLSKFNITKTQGADEIHPYILATFCDHLCKPLCLIYNQSLQSGKLPDDWILANVTPVFKGGQRNLSNNYHPILHHRPVKYYNQLFVITYVITFLTDNNAFSSQQHGFTYQKSCFTNLLETFED